MEQYPESYSGKKMTRLLKYYINKSVKCVSVMVLFAELFCLVSCATQKEATYPPQKAAATPREDVMEITKAEETVKVIKEEKGITEESLQCITCHEERRITHGWVADWQGSKHARKGVGCEACHVSANAELAVKEYQEFMKSRHSIGWQRMLECGKLMALPKDTCSEKCEQCHNIQFKCDSCHTRHTFCTLEAKTPEACRTCHMGSAHPYYEA